MEQIRPKALICFETRTTLHRITSNNSVVLNHRELSPTDFIQTRHKLPLCLWVNGRKRNLESALLPAVPAPTKASANCKGAIAKRRGKTHTPFPVIEDIAKVSWASLGGETRWKWD